MKSVDGYRISKHVLLFQDTWQNSFKRKIKKTWTRIKPLKVLQHICHCAIFSHLLYERLICLSCSSISVTVFLSVSNRTVKSLWCGIILHNTSTLPSYVGLTFDVSFDVQLFLRQTTSEYCFVFFILFYIGWSLAALQSRFQARNWRKLVNNRW